MSYIKFRYYLPWVKLPKINLKIIYKLYDCMNDINKTWKSYYTGETTKLECSPLKIGMCAIIDSINEFNFYDSNVTKQALFDLFTGEHSKLIYFRFNKKGIMDDISIFYDLRLEFIKSVIRLYEFKRLEFIKSIVRLFKLKRYIS